MKTRRMLYLFVCAGLCIAGAVIAQGKIDIPPKRVKSLRVDANGNVKSDQDFSEENINKMLSHEYKPRNGVPTCNDEGIKTLLLDRHFTRPRGQVLGSFLAAGLLMQPENQDMGAWQRNWSGSVQNVRQESLDEANHSRICEADLVSTGGPDDMPSNDALYKQLGLAFCVNRAVIYKIQLTEDGAEPYVTSKCGGRLSG